MQPRFCGYVTAGGELTTGVFALSSPPPLQPSLTTWVVFELTLTTGVVFPYSRLPLPVFLCSG